MFSSLSLWPLFGCTEVFPTAALHVPVSLTKHLADNITSGAANFETVLSLLSSFFVPQDEDALLSWIGAMLGDTKMRSSMGQWRQQWKNLVATGMDSTALL
jgi:hypothetical protein